MSQWSCVSWKLIIAALLSVPLAGCGGGGRNGGGSKPSPDGPTVRDDILEVSGAAVITLDVLANDTDPGGTALTAALDGTPSAGSATVGSDNKISWTPPPNFKGVARVKYRATNTAGKSNPGAAVVFVDTQPFRVVYQANDETGKYDIYVHDLATARRVTSFKTSPPGYAALLVSKNGKTLLYQEPVSSNPDESATGDLFAMPVDGSKPARKVNESLASREFVAEIAELSDDGNWAAYVTQQDTGRQKLWIANLEQGVPPVRVDLPGEVRAVDELSIGRGSGHLYFVAEVTIGAGTGEALFRVPLSSPDTVRRVSPQPTENTSVLDYAVSPDESVMVVHAESGNDGVVYRIRASDPGNADRLSHSLNVGDGESIEEMAVNEAVTRVVYTTSRQSNPRWRAYRADVSQAPSGVEFASIGWSSLESVHLEGVRADGAAALLSVSAASEELHEAELQAHDALTEIDDAAGYLLVNAQYDASGDRVYYNGDERREGVLMVARGAFDRPTTVFAEAGPAFKLAPERTVLVVARVKGQTTDLWVANAADPGKPFQLSGLVGSDNKMTYFAIAPR